MSSAEEVYRPWLGLWPLRRLADNVSRHRHVVKNFVLRDMKVKYRGTVFGYLWSLLEPLSLVGVYWFVFVVIANRGGPEYPLEVMLGVLSFQFFNLVVSGGAAALVSNAALIRRVPLPREIFVFASLCSNAIVLATSLFAAIPFMIAYRITPGLGLLVVPLGIVLIGLIAGGIGLVLACANAVYRDVAYVVRVVLRLAFYATPVIYVVDMVPESIRWIYLHNPIAVSISIIRCGLMSRPFPFAFEHLVFALGVAVISVWLGTHIFYRWVDRAVKFL